MPEAQPDPLTALVSNYVTSDAQSVRRIFYKRVLTSIPIEPRRDLQEICRAWLEATKADWVWLWLQHQEPQERPWELTAAVGRSGTPEDHIPESHENVALDGKDSVAAYATKIERPVLILDIQKWMRESNGICHHVTCLHELTRRNCRSILSVPLIFSRLDAGEAISPYASIGRMRGLICSHFATEGEPTPLQDEGGYMLMGFATTRVLAASFATEQHGIRFELDSLATKYLAVFDKDARLVRLNYLNEVIDLVKRHLRVSYMSVFYRLPDDEHQIECIASTGLRSESKTLAPDRLSEARYRKGEHLTGRVFETGMPYISKIGETPIRPEGGINYKWKERPDNAPESNHSWVCYPIKSPTGTHGIPDGRPTLGVLRCFGNESLLAHQIPRNFDPIQIQTLDFISRQIAPVLETMSAHIQREREIAIIRHDLQNPIRILDAGVEFATSRLSESQLPPHWEADMRFALATAKNLASSLGDTHAVPALEPTLMEAHIIVPQVITLSNFARIQKGMTIQFQNIRETFPALNVDRELIGRVVFNVVMNAVKYGNRGSEIILIGEKNGDDYLLHIQNEGIGLEQDESERIFQGGYRSRIAAHVTQGSGLGLKIARDAMRRHGGDLQLRRIGNPIVFTMVFPERLVAKTSQTKK
jgi:Histidine kinase-, DNA gyrase B-, and HSP90-like ATPase